jgi:apolipoprotein N-acyltransferase
VWVGFYNTVINIAGIVSSGGVAGLSLLQAMVNAIIKMATNCFILVIYENKNRACVFILY